MFIKTITLMKIFGKIKMGLEKKAIIESLYSYFQTDIQGDEGSASTDPSLKEKREQNFRDIAKEYWTFIEPKNVERYLQTFGLHGYIDKNQ